MNKIFISLWMSLLFLWACQYKRIDNKSFKVTKDGNGNIVSEEHYINDTILEGLAKYYYLTPANVLKDEIEFINGIKEGWHKHYLEDGKLESKVHYKNGLTDGKDYRYFEDGVKIKSEHYWKKGKPYGISKWYYYNGQLETFNVTDFYDDILYVIQFDEKGNKIKEEGSVFCPQFVVIYTNDITEIPIKETSVKAREEVAIKIAVAEPPQTQTKIRMGELNKNNMVELPIENYTSIYKWTFNEIGMHTLITVGEIRDLNGNLLRKDSTSMDINVVSFD